MTTKEINLGIIKNIYDKNLSVEENLKNINACGVRISSRQLYRYLEVIKKIEKGGVELDKISDEQIYNFIDISKTIEQNRRLLLEFKGVNVSSGKLCPILRRKRQDLMMLMENSKGVSQQEVEKFLGEIENTEIIDD